MAPNTTLFRGENTSNSSDLFNASMNALNGTNRAPLAWPSEPVLAAIGAAYAAGILANLVAVVYLRAGRLTLTNNKHLLLLTALATNDLAAMVGNMSAMLVGQFVPGARRARWMCCLRVVLRVFGLGSGCIAVTMALERYLALTRPFLYRRVVSYRAVWGALVASWLVAALLTCAPLLELSYYYNEEKGCFRFYNAASTPELAYAVSNVVFGTLLCVVLVYCNVAVIRELYTTSSARAGRHHDVNSDLQASQHKPAISEEVAFSRLMATLSVAFLICWLPRMVCASVFMARGPAHWARLAPLRVGSDMLLLLHYVLNPVLYVLVQRRPLAALRHFVASCLQRLRCWLSKDARACPRTRPSPQSGGHEARLNT